MWPSSVIVNKWVIAVGKTLVNTISALIVNTLSVGIRA